MADFGSPVAQDVNVNPQQGIQTLSGLIGLQTSQQNLQQQQIATQAAQRQQQARSFLTGMMQSKKDEQGNSILDATGEPDPAKVTAAVARNIPADLAQPIIQSVIKSQSDRIGLEAASAGLDMTHRKNMMGIVQQGALDPNGGSAGINAGLDQYVSQHPEAGPTAQYLKSLVTHLDNVPPEGRARAAQTIAAHMQPGEAVETQPSNATVNTGRNIVQGTVAPPVSGGKFDPSTSMPVQIPPGYGVTQDSRTGNFYVYSLSNPNDVRPLGQSGPGKSQSNQNPNAPPVMTPGEPATIGAIQKEVEGLRTAGTQLGTNRDINRRILALNQQTSSGPGSNFIHQAAAAAHLPEGASYQELNSFLDRQAAQAANAMGLPNTNMGLETSKNFTGNTQLDNKVIADKTKFVDSLNDAAQKYLAGANRAVGTGPNPNYTAYQKFRADWSQNFDPEIFAYENAVKNGDAPEKARIESDLGRKGMRELYEKRKALIGAVNGQQ